jgi:DNA-binding MarR family transcriptional regulator
MPDAIAAIAERLLKVLNKFLANQKRPRRYGLPELLYPAEVHLIMLIGKYPGNGVTELASKSGVTKGAVSQMVQRLEQKRLITKSTDPRNRTRIVLELTNKGRVAYYSHERLHEDADRDLFDFLGGLHSAQLNLLERFLELVERGIDKRSET